MNSENEEPKKPVEHTIADDEASAKADAAFAQGKWQEFTGQELAPDHIINSSNYPDFYRPVEERQDLDAEALAKASESFRELFNDLMLQDMDEVRQFESTPGRPTARLSKHIVVGGQTFSLNLVDKHTDENSDDIDSRFRSSEKISREISMQRIDKGYGREHWSYRLGADGVVRRYDLGDITGKNIKERELGIEQPKMLGLGEDLTREEVQDMALSGIDMTLSGIARIVEALPNNRLEEDMGLNNQPVSSDEIDGLKGFISKATSSPR